MKKIIILICSILFIAGCSSVSSDKLDKVTRYQENYEITGEEKDEIIGDIHEKVYETIERKEKDEEENLDIGTKADRPYQVPTGRYEIYGYGTGFIYIHDENEEIIHHDFFAYGMEPININIKEEYLIRFNGLDRLFIKQVDTEFTNTITPGIWEVGIDIKPGNYVVTGEGYGYLSLLEPTKESRLFEVIGGPYSNSKSKIELTEGQKVVIHGARQVHLEPND